jgi:hypothetical protein
MYLGIIIKGCVYDRQNGRYSGSSNYFFLLSIIEITKGTTYNIEIAVPGGTARSIMNISSIILGVRNFDLIN